MHEKSSTEDLQSPHDIGLYLAGFVSDVHDGTTRSTQLKLRPILASEGSRIGGWRGTKEERHGDTLSRRSIVDSMDSAFMHIVAESHYKVADINDNRSLDRNSLDPLSLSVQHLQTASHVLPQKHKQLQISVASKSHSIAGSFLLRRCRVVVEGSVSAWIRDSTIEVVFFEIQAQRKDLHEFAG